MYQQSASGHCTNTADYNTQKPLPAAEGAREHESPNVYKCQTPTDRAQVKVPSHMRQKPAPGADTAADAIHTPIRTMNGHQSSLQQPAHGHCTNTAGTPKAFHSISHVTTRSQENHTAGFGGISCTTACTTPPSVTSPPIASSISRHCPAPPIRLPPYGDSMLTAATPNDSDTSPICAAQVTSHQDAHQLPDSTLEVRAMRMDPVEYSSHIHKYWPQPTEEAMEVAPLHMDIYRQVRATGLPNYMTAKCPIPSDMIPDHWDQMLEGYYDREITQYIRYGWPASYTAPTPPTSTYSNHLSARQQPQAVSDFISKELQKSAILGPFDQNPFDSWTQVSPVMTRPKKDGGTRVIIDLSHPKDGTSVNAGILKNFSQGHDMVYTLPTIGDLAELIKNRGATCWLWKADLQRAYRQMRLDPLDYPLFGIRHENKVYLDICPSFGCRFSGGAQQRLSNAVTYLMGQNGHKVLAYVDDFCGIAATYDEALGAYEVFHKLCTHLGLSLAPEKSQPPNTQIEWLGFYFNTDDMILTIPDEKLREVHELCDVWMTALTATKKDFQSIAGKLNHLAQCVQHARKFMGRILAASREAPETGEYSITDQVRADINWFRQFASRCNGRLLLTRQRPHLEIECDACKQGGGGFSITTGEYYSFSFPEVYTTNFHITQLEAINIVMAIKTLVQPATRRVHVQVHTDNMPAMYALNTGKTKDPILQACARELFLIAALQELDITITHVPGVTLVLADALSRCHENRKLGQLASQLIAEKELTEANPVELECVLSAI